MVKRILKKLSKPVGAVIGDAQALRALDANQFTDDRFGLPTVGDILKELEKPGRDPRPEFQTAKFAEGVDTIRDLRPGMILEGTVSNVAAFGAFVDLGVHQDGLVHISAMSDRFVKDPRTVARAGDVVKVKVMDIDLERKRIALSMRLDDPLPDEAESPEKPESKSAGAKRRRNEKPNKKAPQAKDSTFAAAFAKARQK